MAAIAADPYANSPDKTAIHHALISHLAQWISYTQPETLLDLTA